DHRLDIREAHRALPLPCRLDRQALTLDPVTARFELLAQVPQTAAEKIPELLRLRPVDLLGEEHPARGEHAGDLGDVVALVTIHHEIERAIVERHLRMVVAVVSGHVDLVVLERRGGQGNVRLPPFRGGDRRPRLTGRSGLAEAVDEFDEALAAAGAHIEATARRGQLVEADLVEVPRRVIGDESTVQWAEVPPRHRRSVMDPGPPLVAFLRCLVAGATAVGIFGHVHTPLPDGSAPPAAPMPYFDSRPVMACDARGIASFLANLGRRDVEPA